MLQVIEHEILKAIHETAYFTIRSNGNETNGHIPLFKREMPMSFLHFGALVDIINNPEKYENVFQKPTEPIIKTIEEVEIKKYTWEQASNAIDVLAANNHIKDENDIVLFEGTRRVIQLTLEGAMAYRNRYYLKDAIKEKHEQRQYWQTKYWYIAETVKFFIGGIVGALLTLLAIQKDKLMQSVKQPEQNSTQQKKNENNNNVKKSNTTSLIDTTKKN